MQAGVRWIRMWSIEIDEHNFTRQTDVINKNMLFMKYAQHSNWSNFEQ